MTRTGILRIGLLVLVLVALGVWRWEKILTTSDRVVEIVQERKTRATVNERLEECGEAARGRFLGQYEEAGIEYPPSSLTFIGLKQEKLLEVYAQNESSDPVWIKTYPIKAASGELGPKTRQGDRQVPEGIYRIEYLNPNSSYHLSMKISYPNDFDNQKAREESRSDLGGDIMIHGGAASIGCLAMGDEAVEEIFVMAAETGYDKIEVILSPLDFRQSAVEQVPLPESAPEWTGNLHQVVREKLLSIQKKPA